jgi:hypothetical protein
VTPQDAWLSDFRERRDALLAMFVLNRASAEFKIPSFFAHNRAEDLIRDASLIVEAQVIASKEEERSKPKGVTEIAKRLRSLLADIEGRSA